MTIKLTGVVSTPSGHDVAIYEACASFHNLSLALLCWVTLSMLHRPYWVKSDFYIGLVAALIQFGFNVWRVFPHTFMPELVHGQAETNKHKTVVGWLVSLVVPGASWSGTIFSGAATACAIIFVQVCLVRRDQRDQHKAELKVASMS